MNTKSKTYLTVASRFRITDDPQRWSLISAASVLAVDGVGKKFLNSLRLHLAHQGISLLGDNPPAYWLDVLTRYMVNGEPVFDRIHGACPFTIVIDTNETFPFTFDAISDRDGNLVSVPTVRRPLYLSGLADYTISGMETLIQIERKADDLFSSMSERREIFESEVSRLNSMCEFAAVLCELPRSQILLDNQRWGARSKSIISTVSHWRVRYPGVHFIFADGRYDAEQECYRLLSAFWWQKMRERAAQAAELQGLFE